MSMLRHKGGDEDAPNDQRRNGRPILAGGVPLFPELRRVRRGMDQPDVALFQSGRDAGSEGKRIIFQKLYEREWEEARERAVTDAMETFNLCPICRRLVCNRCFLLGEDIDLCADCARNLQERGEPVAPKEESG